MADAARTGRAGRLWLIDRLSAARRGADLLDRKRQLLRNELTELRERQGGADRELARVTARAENWALRSAVLGGERDIALVAASLDGKARAEVGWENRMGVRYPSSTSLSCPDLDPLALGLGNAALAPTTRAYRELLEAAVTCAALHRAVRSIEKELTATTRRVRAIERHRIPDLEQNLRSLQLRLDELDREDRVTARWAFERSSGQRSEPGGALGRSPL